MSKEDSLRIYLNELRQIAQAPSATEHSYRHPMVSLFTDFADLLNRPVSRIILEPGNVTDAGAPDAIVFGTTTQELIGYIETKNLGKDLDNLHGHDLDQFKRYLSAFPVWIYTNYLEYRLYENGHLTNQIVICHKQQLFDSATINQNAIRKAPELVVFLDRFFQLTTPQITEAHSLASILAHKARLLEQALIHLLTIETPNETLLSQVEAYRRWLISDLSIPNFADYYAQTLTYGIFYAAFINNRRPNPIEFNRSNLLELLPSTIRPIRAIFQLLAAQFLPQEIDWIIEDLIRILGKADMNSISLSMGESRDPVVHFYESFLEEYDPELRDARGVYYTPDEVVNYIVRSIDLILRQFFDKVDGLGSPDVSVLDPAMGTGTFLAHAIMKVVENFGPAQAGALTEHLRHHTLNQWYGFELLVAPYVLAYLKLGEIFRTLHITDISPKLYLTNTLDDHVFPSTLPGPFEQAISEDSQSAQRIKSQERILVILGNPPYKGSSHNVYNKISDYRVPGERARNWLQNDYIKFIRWSEWKITESIDSGFQHGIIGLITDHSYLNGPLFAGMRKHLFESFNLIYILDLHGNSLYETRPPTINRDDNVFDIQEGVAIILLVKTPNQNNNRQVKYADLWGNRQSKYDYLQNNTVNTTSWEPVNPTAPRFFLTPRTYPRKKDEYQNSPSLPEIFPVCSQAIVTARDSFAIDINRQDLISRINSFISHTGNEAQISEEFDIRNTREFNITQVHQSLSTSFDESKVVPVQFRPYDNRWIYYSNEIIEWPRKKVFKHIVSSENYALAFFRHTRRPTLGRVYISKHITDARLLSSESNCYSVPLYIYTHQLETNGQLSLDTTDGTNREPNLHPALLSRLSTTFGNLITPIDLINYLYGIMNSPGYLQEFEILLQEDFPRIPFTANFELFRDMCIHGERMKNLHLLDAPDINGLSNLLIGFPIEGYNLIMSGFPSYDPTQERVYINPTQYFSNIPPSVWDYEIGCYSPSQKWLSLRIGTTLGIEDLLHYETFNTAIIKIIDMLPDIEKTWDAINKSDWINPIIG